MKLAFKDWTNLGYDPWKGGLYKYILNLGREGLVARAKMHLVRENKIV